MGIGKQVRLARIFSHPSGRLCSIAIDHFIGYQQGLPDGLTNLAATLKPLMDERPDAVTMLKGAAKHLWPQYAGQAALIVSSIMFTADDAVIECTATPEDAMLLGADAIAVAIGVRGPNEGKFLKILCDQVQKADRLELPVIAHVYPRDFSGEPRVVHDAENIMWAVRCGIECGADVIKVPFTGDAASFRDIVQSSPTPVVAAGGPKTHSLEDGLRMMELVLKSGAHGATIGRNIWGAAKPVAALRAYRAIIHDEATVDELLNTRVLAGLK